LIYANLVTRYAARGGICSIYPPDQSRIEQVWRAIKRGAAVMFIAGREHLMATNAEAVEKLVEGMGVYILESGVCF